MRRAPVIRPVTPRVRPWLDSAKAVITFTVGQGAAYAAEVWVQRRQVAVVLVTISTACVGLPDFHQGMRNRLAILIAHATCQDDPLAYRQTAIIEIQQQVVVELAELKVGKVRPAGLTHRLRDAHQRLTRGTGNGSLVVRGQSFGVPVAVTDDKAPAVCIRHVDLLLFL